METQPNIPPPPLSNVTPILKSNAEWYGFIAALVFSALYGLYLLIYGLLIVVGRYERRAVEATIKEIKCLSSTSDYNCSVYLEYNYNGNSYTKWLDNKDKTEYAVGSKLVIYIKNKEPTDIDTEMPPNSYMGKLSLLAGVIILVLSGYTWKLKM